MASSIVTVAARWALCMTVLVGFAASAHAQAPSDAARAARAGSPEARDHLASAKHAAATGQWIAAAQEYEQANQIEPSAAAAEGIAKARDALHDDVKAYVAFNAMLRDYPQALNPNLRRYGQKRLQALARQTGTFNVKIVEIGARVSLDGIDVGATPLPAPLRVTPGTHRLRVSKVGFQDASVEPAAVAGVEVAIPIVLAPELHTGHVSVHERLDRPISVFIDGVLRGPAPWQGEVEPGSHEVSGRGDGLSAVAQVVTVSRAATTDVELQATLVVTRVSVTIVGRKGSVYVDGRVVGEGFFNGELPVGLHTLRLARDGYEQFEKDVVLVEGRPYIETVSLPPITVVQGDSSAAPMHGGYGGVLVDGSFEPDGVHGDFTPPCSPQAAGCTASSPVGFGLLGYAGFISGVVGLDALFGLQADSGNTTLPAAAPAGSTTRLTLARGGAVGALRARLAWQAPGVRLTLAGGLGAAVRAVRIVQNGTLFDLFTGGSQEATYAAPAITVEGAVHWRVASGTALSLGLLYWGENAGSGILVGAQPLTGNVRAVSGTQSFFMPFLGVELGP
jgi:PEGA domain